MRILMVRMGAMGDIVHTLPSAATLRYAFPEAEIDWLVEERWAPLLEGNPHVSTVRRIGRRIGRATWKAIGELRARHYDLALDFQGLLKSAVISRLAAPREVIGFRAEELRERLAGAFYNRRADGSGQHVVEKNLSLAFSAGASKAVIEFPLPDVPVPEGLPEKFFALSPSAGWAAKRWPPEAFAQLILRVKQNLGLPAVINCGPGEEYLTARIVETAREAGPHVAVGGIAELVALAGRARVFVAGDTGPLHVAAAAGTPVVAIFGPTDPARNGPYSKRARVVRAAGATTTYSRSAGGESVARVSVEQVFTALREVIEAG